MEQQKDSKLDTKHTKIMYRILQSLFSPSVLHQWPLGSMYQRETYCNKDLNSTHPHQALRYLVSFLNEG